MRSETPVLVLLAILVAGCGAEEPTPVPARPPAKDPAVVAPAPPTVAEPVVQPEPYRVRVLRTTTEVMVFAVRGGRSLPAGRVPVRIVSPEEGDGVETATASSGIAVFDLASHVTGEIVVGPAGRTATVPLPPAPAATADEVIADRFLLTDRSAARPGDSVRVAVWLDRLSDRDEAGLLTLPGDDPETVKFLPGGGRPPGWSLAHVIIPTDARPGRARLQWKEGTAVLPIVGRHGDTPDFDVTDPEEETTPADPTPADGDLSIEPEDGHWRVTAPSPMDGRPLVLVAYERGEIVSHATATVEEASALMRLALGDRSARGIRLLAMAATRDGFVEGERLLAEVWKGAALELKATPLDGTGRVRLEGSAVGGSVLDELMVALDDPDRPDVRPRIHLLDGPDASQVIAGLEPGARYRLRALGRLDGGGRMLVSSLPRFDAVPGEAPAPKPPFQRTADILGVPARVRPVPLTRWTVRVDLAPGETMSESDRLALLEPHRAALTWSALAPEDAAGPMRLSTDGIIALETRLEAGNDAGRRGVLDRRVLEVGPAELRAAVPGLRALRLEAMIFETGVDDAPVSEGYTVDRTLSPDPGRPGLRIATVSIATGLRRLRTFVEMPLPAGLEPAVDGWELREALRAGLPEEARQDARVHVTTTAIHWDVPLVPETGLELRIPLRDRHAGTWTWPPVHVNGEGDRSPRGRSSGGRIVVESP